MASTITLLRVLPPLPPLPQDAATPLGARLRAAVTVIRVHGVLALCTATVLLVIGNFAAYTYIAPLVRRDGGPDGLALSALLLGYGVAGLLANLLVGRLVDRYPGPMLTGLISSLTAALALLALTPGIAGTVVAVILWGAAFTVAPICLQTAVLRIAPQARDAATAVYVVAFQIGIGGGALLGERLYEAGHLDLLPVLPAVLAPLAGLAAVGARRAFPLRDRRVPGPEPVPAAP
jgi:predicted MFS family arabinose efflux permease